MLDVPDILQLLLAVALMLLGVSGNLAIPFVSYRSTLRCPHVKVLAALDFTATLLGPGIMIVTLVTDPAWLEHNKTLCQSLTFLSAWVQIACFLVLFILAVFCQKVKHSLPPSGRRHANRREAVFLVMSLLIGFLLSLPPVVGWSSYNGLPLMHSCIPLHYVHSLLIYSNFYLAFSFAVLSIAIFLAIRALKRHRLYPVQLLWERHKYEMKINDPEMTTVTSSSQSRITNRSNRSYWSRRSSGRSGFMSVLASPLASRKSSHQFRAQDSVLVEVLLRQANLNVKGLVTGGNGTSEEAGKEPNMFLPPGTALENEAEWRGRSISNLREPYIISSGIPHNLPRKKVFQNPRVLPPFKALQKQQSLSRFLMLKSCVTILCWLLLCCTVVLQLCSVHYPQEIQVLIQWLIFVPSAFSPLFPLCEPSYRLVLRQASYSVLKACVFGSKTQTAESDDVEFKVEETEQVRLVEIRPLQLQTLH